MSEKTEEACGLERTRHRNHLGTLDEEYRPCRALTLDLDDPDVWDEAMRAPCGDVRVLRVDIRHRGRVGTFNVIVQVLERETVAAGNKRGGTAEETGVNVKLFPTGGSPILTRLDMELEEGA